jgi:hypothetical protein
MKALLAIFVCFLLCILSCKKNELPAKQTFDIHHSSSSPTIVTDPRDTVSGDYSGTMHHVRTTVWGAYTTIDTTYPYTLHVTIDISSTSNANSLWMDGIEMDANSSYAVQMNYFWRTNHPRQSANGQFTLHSTYTGLNFMHADGWQGTADTYTFQGNK